MVSFLNSNLLATHTRISCSVAVYKSYDEETIIHIVNSLICGQKTKKLHFAQKTIIANKISRLLKFLGDISCANKLSFEFEKNIEDAITIKIEHHQNIKFRIYYDSDDEMDEATLLYKDTQGFHLCSGSISTLAVKVKPLLL